jgi:hypothetical protein
VEEVWYVCVVCSLDSPAPFPCEQHPGARPRPGTEADRKILRGADPTIRSEAERDVLTLLAMLHRNS